MKRYFGWCCEASMREEFEIKDTGGMSVLFADHSGGYEDNAYVLLLNYSEGSVYEVHAFHCSCYGFEDQWRPEKCAIDALSIPSWLEREDLIALRQIVDEVITRRLAQ